MTTRVFRSHQTTDKQLAHRPAPDLEQFAVGWMNYRKHRARDVQPIIRGTGLSV